MPIKLFTRLRNTPDRSGRGSFSREDEQRGSVEVPQRGCPDGDSSRSSTSKFSLSAQHAPQLADTIADSSAEPLLTRFESAVNGRPQSRGRRSGEEVSASDSHGSSLLNAKKSMPMIRQTRRHSPERAAGKGRPSGSGAQLPPSPTPPQKQQQTSSTPTADRDTRGAPYSGTKPAPHSVRHAFDAGDRGDFFGDRAEGSMERPSTASSRASPRMPTTSLSGSPTRLRFADERQDFSQYSPHGSVSGTSSGIQGGVSLAPVRTPTRSTPTRPATSGSPSGGVHHPFGAVRQTPPSSPHKHGSPRRTRPPTAPSGIDFQRRSEWGYGGVNGTLSDRSGAGGGMAVLIPANFGPAGRASQDSRPDNQSGSSPTQPPRRLRPSGPASAAGTGHADAGTRQKSPNLARPGTASMPSAAQHGSMSSAAPQSQDTKDTYTGTSLSPPPPRRRGGPRRPTTAPGRPAAEMAAAARGSSSLPLSLSNDDQMRREGRASSASPSALSAIAASPPRISVLTKKASGLSIVREAASSRCEGEQEDGLPATTHQARAWPAPSATTRMESVPFGRPSDEDNHSDLWTMAGTSPSSSTSAAETPSTMWSPKSTETHAIVADVGKNDVDNSLQYKQHHPAHDQAKQFNSTHTRAHQHGLGIHVRGGQLCS